MKIKRPLCAVCLFFSAAVAALLLLFGQEEAPVSGHEGERIVLSGRVYQYRQYEERTVLWLKDLEAAEEAALSAGAGAAPDRGSGTFLSRLSKEDRCICYCNERGEARIGARVCVEGAADGFDSARNPGEFDYARYYRTQDIGFCIRDAEVLNIRSGGPLADAWGRLCSALARVRQDAAAILADYLSGEDAGVLSAMLLGDKSMLDEEISALYREGGISHILAISGLHISLLGTLVYRLLARTALPRRAAMGVSAVLLLLYGSMTGFGLSSRRALLMFLIGLNAERVGRTYDMRTALFVSMSLLLLRRPRQLETAAFQLSFGAVLGISLLRPALLCLCGMSPGCGKRRPSKLLSSLFSCIGVSLATLPVQLSHQYEYAAYGVLLNLLVLPSVSVLLPCGVCVLLLGAAARLLCTAPGIVSWALSQAAGAGARAAAFVCHGLLSLYQAGSRLILSLPGGRILGRPGCGRLVLYAVMLTLLAYGAEPIERRIRRRREGKRKKAGRLFLAGGAAYLLLALLLLLAPAPWRRGLKITVLDVGQGDGICLSQTPGHALLIDCGSTDCPSLLEDRLVPFLKYEGIHRLDAVFLSHLDKDHTSAVEALLEKEDTAGITVGQLVLAERTPHDEAYGELVSAAGAAGVPVRTMREGDFYEQGRLRLTCLAPADGTASDDRNACSLVLMLDYGNFGALFMGDADAESELAVLDAWRRRARPGGIALLKVAHHGSAASCTEEFLRTVRPKAAVISCGVDNRYGHPAKETVGRLRDAGIVLAVTKECGAVTVMTDGNSFSVRTFLQTVVH